VDWAEACLHAMPSFILIHPTFGHNTPTAQTEQDKQTGQWSNSIGRTVLQTVAQKVMDTINSHYHSSTAKLVPYYYEINKTSCKL